MNTKSAVTSLSQPKPKLNVTKNLASNQGVPETIWRYEDATYFIQAVM